MHPAQDDIAAAGNASSAALNEDRILSITELRDLERSNILRALEAASWKISGADGAAELIGMNPNTLSSRMKALKIGKPRTSEK